MEVLRSETTRLRRTFNYPSESSDEDAVEEGMDEQDQETLLATLSNKDTTSTNLYTHILLVLPLAPILLYLPRLLAPSSILPSLAAIASLLASAYTLYFLPLPPVRVNVIDASGRDLSSWVEGKGKGKGKGKATARDADGRKAADGSGRRPVPYVSEEMADVLAGYMVPVNAAVCAILAVAEFWQGREWSEGMSIGGGYLPGLIMTVVMWARRELRVVDLGELEKLRYRSKGT